MKIVDIGICVDNKDPKGLGRIRYVRYNDYIGSKEKAIDYEPWSDRDLFIANPFLPLNINFIPEKDQAVKIINYDTDKETVNAEYIAGPFSTTYNFNSQQYSDQVENTSYGISVKHGDDIFDREGNYREPKASGALAEKTDYGIYGKYGSDIIFTEDGLQIRGGKLISKPFADLSKKEKLVSQPIMSETNKIASLHLKKFPKSLDYVEEEVTEKVVERAQVKYFLEYEILENFDENSTANRTINFFIYDTQKAGNLFRIENPKLESVEITSGCTLINKNNFIYKNNPNFVNSDPTYSITVTGATETYVAIRNVLSNFGRNGFPYFDSIFKEKNVHPFYFRPSKKMLEVNLAIGSAEWNFRNTIYNRTTYFQKVGKGLIYSKNSSVVPEKSVKKKIRYVKDPDGKKEEQTFASVKSDRIYLLSTEKNRQTPEYTPQPIDFNKLNRYEIDQNNYLNDIEPNTYSLVRGELLVKIIRCMRDLFISHVHGICTPMIQPDPKYTELEGLLKNLETDLLNQSIRIN